MPTLERMPIDDMLLCAYSDIMINGYKVRHGNYSVECEMENAIEICKNFYELVNLYGIDCVGKKAPTDNRYKVYRNGSYFELAGLCFTYNYIHGTDVVYWTCADYDSTCIINGMRLSRGELIVRFVKGDLSL